MLRALLRRWFGLATLDLQRVGQALAAGILDDYGGMLAELDPSSTTQYFRTQYMRLVSRYGLPADSCNEVADRAWSLIAQARGSKDASQPAHFAFYD